MDYSILLEPDRVAALAYVYARERRLHWLKFPEPGVEALQLLARDGYVSPSLEQVTDTGIGYACFEQFRQTSRPDSFMRLVAERAEQHHKALDLCCGPGATVRAMLEGDLEQIVALDLNPQFIDAVRLIYAASGQRRPALDARTADAHRIPLADGAVDLAICRVALQYLDVAVVLGELYRTLEGGGQLLVLVHGPGYPLHHLRSGRLKLGLRLLLNGLSYNTTGRRMLPGEVFLTPKRLARDLRKAGFTNIRVHRSPEWLLAGLDSYFGVIADKPAR